MTDPISATLDVDTKQGSTWLYPFMLTIHPAETSSVDNTSVTIAVWFIVIHDFLFSLLVNNTVIQTNQCMHSTHTYLLTYD